MTRDYAGFLEAKAQLGAGHGFTPLWMPSSLFDWQAKLVEWALLRGRALLAEDCGLGKTLQELVWAENVARKTGKPVLILTPLAVSQQTVREGEKFGIAAARSSDGSIPSHVTVTNYERLHHFKSEDFAGVVCDESSILKSFDGARKAEITEFMRRVQYRLLATATAAPNDYIELGTSSEALGELGYVDMLNRFFKNDAATSAMNRNYGSEAKWRFKGHAESAFWRWMCSWARAIRKPSDLGFDDGAFILPKLTEVEHVVRARVLAPGTLFSMPAAGLQEQREERRRTLDERCERVAELVATKKPAVCWCHLNDEGDRLADIIKDAEQVSGADADDAKEEKFAAFESGQLRVLVIKPKIGAWGLNWQHCSHMTFFPSHSYEQYYQGVRRCWRFGQRSQVKVDIVTTEGEQEVKKNLQRKAAQADRMFSALVAHMTDALKIDRAHYDGKQTEVPPWLSKTS